MLVACRHIEIWDTHRISKGQKKLFLKTIILYIQIGYRGDILMGIYDLKCTEPFENE